MPRPGQEITSIAGHRCFLPAHLPPHGLVVTATARRLHDEALHRLGQLEGASRLLPNPDLLTYALLALESIASSRIEGTIASPDELVLFQLEPSGWGERVREVSNHNRALRHGIEEIKNRTISLSLILELHSLLMQDVRGSTFAGKLKDKQNFIGLKPGDAIADALYVPPPPEFTAELLGNLVSYINGPQDEPVLVRLAISHYQFEAIHPFGDGNGRIGRLLIVLGLIKDRLLTRPMMHPSVFLEENRDRYFDLLAGIQQSGDWEPWIEFFLTAVLRQGQASLKLIQEVSDVRQSVRDKVSEVRKSATASRVIEAFFDHPVQTVAQVSASSGVSINAARSAIEDLAGQTILREITGKKSRRAYVCEPIWRAIFK